MVIINNGEPEFSGRNSWTGSPLRVAPFCRSHFHSLHLAAPSTKKTLVTANEVLRLFELTKPTALSVDSLVQEHFLYREDIASSQRPQK